MWWLACYLDYLGVPISLFQVLHTWLFTILDHHFICHIQLCPCDTKWHHGPFHQWFRFWIDAWRHQAITWANTELSSTTHPGPYFHEILFTFFRKSPSWNSPLPIVFRTRRYAITHWLQPLAPLEIHGDVQKDATSCWSSWRARIDLRISLPYYLNNRTK